MVLYPVFLSELDGVPGVVADRRRAKVLLIPNSVSLYENGVVPVIHLIEKYTLV